MRLERFDRIGQHIGLLIRHVKRIGRHVGWLERHTGLERHIDSCMTSRELKSKPLVIAHRGAGHRQQYVHNQLAHPQIAHTHNHIAHPYHRLAHNILNPCSLFRTRSLFRKRKGFQLSPQTKPTQCVQPPQDAQLLQPSQGVLYENSVEAFRRAKEVGADWVECDARRTSDGCVVVHHDAHLANGQRLLHTHSGALPSHIPSLAEAFEVCGEMGVLVEIKNLPGDPDFDKSNEIAFAVAGLIAAYLDTNRIMVSSFDVSTINAVKAADSKIPTALVCGVVDPASTLSRASAYNIDAIHPYEVTCTPNFVDAAQNAGLTVFVWTVNSSTRMAELVDMGVDGIITDHASVARHIIDKAHGVHSVDGVDQTHSVDQHHKVDGISDPADPV